MEDVGHEKREHQKINPAMVSDTGRSKLTLESESGPFGNGDGALVQGGDPKLYPLESVRESAE
ncbi:MULTISPECIES: hypothetical protein [unclassified Microbacterium]|uniref:hypothetical protein n=1 Tax=Microbacterium sp. Se63.02b TaxID=2709304 RepID=UPI001FCEC7E3|nr:MULTISPECIES: hypothetical protein [unclassified Microbacterium]